MGGGGGAAGWGVNGVKRTLTPSSQRTHMLQLVIVYGLPFESS